MGLFHSHADHPNQPNDKEALLQNQLRLASAPYEPMTMGALQWLVLWAFPEGQVDRVDHPAGGYEWRLWHTRDDHSQFVDVTVMVVFADRRPDKPQSFLVDFQTPGGWKRSELRPLTREDLHYALRCCVTTPPGA